MRKLCVILVVSVFFMAASLVMAQTDTKKADRPAAADKKINCCIKGECKELTKAECRKEKGKVVKDCTKDCKPTPPKPEKKRPE